MTDSFLKTISIYSFSRIIASLSQIIFFLMFASLLSVEEYGQMSYLISLAATVAIITRFGLPLSIVVYQAKEKKELANRLNALLLITSVIGGFSLFFINYLVSLLCIMMSVFLMSQSNLVGLGKFRKNLVNAIIRGVLILIMPYLFYLIWGMEGILLGMTLSFGLAGLDLFKYLKFDYNIISEIKSKYKILVSNYGIDLSIELPRFADKILIAPLFGYTIVGYYQLNLQILFAMEIIPIAFHKFLLAQESKGVFNAKIVYTVILVSVLLTIIGYFLLPYIVPIILPNYESVIPSLQLMIMSIVPITIGWIITAKLQARESKYVGITFLFRIIPLFVGIIILGKMFDLIGLSLSIIISSLTNLGFLLFLFYIKKQKV